MEHSAPVVGPQGRRTITSCWLASAAIAVIGLASAQAQVAVPSNAAPEAQPSAPSAVSPAIYIKPTGPMASINYADGQAYTYQTETRWHAMCGSTPLTEEQLKQIDDDHAAQMADQAHILVIDTPRQGASTRGPGFNLIFNINTTNMPAGAATSFTIAEAYIESQFTDPVTVTVNISWANLGGSVIGSTGSTYVSGVAYSTARAGLVAGMDGDDTIQAFLPTGSTLPVRYNATSATVTNENQVFFTLANYKATIGTGSGIDANMQYNSAFSFDFDPSNGVGGSLLSLVDTVIHEVGHSMGFTSGADFRTNDLEALDLYRFARTDRAGIGNTNPDTTADFQTVAREVDNNLPTNDDVNSDLISAEYRMSDGSPYQASHFFEQSTNPSLAIGIMQPALANGQTFYPNFYKTSDRDMLDAIGWDHTNCSVPSITAQPSAATVCLGAPINLSVTATGAISYQWRKNTVNISGATASSYSIASSGAGDSGTYDVVVTNACGNATSSGAVVTVAGDPVITLQPFNRSACSGASNSFIVIVSGGGSVSYQWRKGVTDIPGATASTYTIPAVAPADAGVYSCLITGSCSSVLSDSAALDVTDPAGIGSQPQASQTVCAGATVNFTVTGTGTNPTYQWQKGFVDIVGATSPTLTIVGVTAADAGEYACLVGNFCGNMFSNSAFLNVNTGASFTTSPASQSVCSGSGVTFTAAATGSPAPTLQWRKNGVNIGGATGSSYSIPAANAGSAGSYDCVATNSCGSVPSNAALLTVNAAPVFSLQPSSTSACDGQPFSFSVAATTTVTYQWRKNTVNIGGATSATFGGTANAGAVGSYDCVLTNACGSTISNAAALAVDSGPTITTQPASITVASGAPVSLTVAASSSSSLSYQWRRNSSNLSNTGPYTGTATNTLNIAAATPVEAGNFDVVITDACASATSSIAILGVTSTCPADLDNGTGTGTPDGGIDINDLLYFLAQFEAGAPGADLANGSGQGVPDGGVDINDLLYFLSHFELGC